VGEQCEADPRGARILGGEIALFFGCDKQVFSKAIEPLTPGATSLGDAASDADQLAAEAIASSTRRASESDFQDFTAWCSEFGLVSFTELGVHHHR
jgi:hypothetical protein